MFAITSLWNTSFQRNLKDNTSKIKLNSLRLFFVYFWQVMNDQYNLFRKDPRVLPQTTASMLYEWAQVSGYCLGLPFLFSGQQVYLMASLKGNWSCCKSETQHASFKCFSGNHSKTQSAELIFLIKKKKRQMLLFIIRWTSRGDKTRRKGATVMIQVKCVEI